MNECMLGMYVYLHHQRKCTRNTTPQQPPSSPLTFRHCFLFSRAPPPGGAAALSIRGRKDCTIGRYATTDASQTHEHNSSAPTQPNACDNAIHQNHSANNTSRTLSDTTCGAIAYKHPPVHPTNNLHPTRCTNRERRYHPVREKRATQIIKLRLAFGIKDYIHKP